MEHPTPDWIAERLLPVAREQGVALPADCFEALADYVRLVLEWGRRMNLTGARTPEALVDEHLADAVALLRWLPGGSFRLVDVGSGAGLPGLVLAILRPDCEAVLLEPRQKRHAFLAHAVRELGLGSRVICRRERLEEHRPDGLYDVAVSRATWPAADWIERGTALVRHGGRVIGVEGNEAGALPAGSARHPYRLGVRPRAVVLRDRPG